MPADVPAVVPADVPTVVPADVPAIVPAVVPAVSNLVAPQALEAELATALADLFTTVKARDAGLASGNEKSFVRNTRLPRARRGGGGRLREVEGYREWDVATSNYHAKQTRGVASGSLVWVNQGAHGATSMMLVFAGGDTLLVRAT